MNDYTGGNYLIYKSSFLATRVIANYLEPVELELEIGFQFGPTEAKAAEAPTLMYFGRKKKL